MSVASNKPINFLNFLRQTSTYKLGELKDIPDSPTMLDFISQKINIPVDEIKPYYEYWLSIPQITLKNSDPALTKLIPEEIAKRCTALAVALENNYLTITFANPLNIDAIAAVTQYARKFKIIIAISKEEELKYLLHTAYQHKEEIQDVAEQLNVLAAEENITKISDYEIATLKDESQVSSLLNTILSDAIEQDASDIHIEYENNTLHLRYRIATVLVEQANLPRNIADILLRRILIISKGDITELRLPQDTSFDYEHKNNKFGVRVSILFTSSGYTIVLRLLRGASFYESLRSFIHDDAVYQKLECFLTKRNGMLLISGPTSSGKTTTIYSALSHVNNPKTKIITMEDPVESEIPGINQVEINPVIGLDFSDVIRSCLRQNPDVLMVGEIRDQVSAVMSLRAAITGIMVMATIHTKNTTAIVLRLLDLGVEPAMIAMGISLLMSQRLISSLCEHCKVVTPLTSMEAQLLEVVNPALKSHSFYTCQGCAKCNYSGHGKPLAIFEILEMSQELANSILSSEKHDFSEVAKRELEGKTLLDNALKLAIAGKTSLAEVFKISYSGFIG